MVRRFKLDFHASAVRRRYDDTVEALDGEIARLFAARFINGKDFVVYSLSSLGTDGSFDPIRMT